MYDRPQPQPKWPSLQEICWCLLLFFLFSFYYLLYQTRMNKSVSPLICVWLFQGGCQHKKAGGRLQHGQKGGRTWWHHPGQGLHHQPLEHHHDHHCCQHIYPQVVLHLADGEEIPCFPFSNSMEAENVSKYSFLIIKPNRSPKNLLHTSLLRNHFTISRINLLSLGRGLKIARVRNCPEITILKSLLGLSVFWIFFVFLSFDFFLSFFQFFCLFIFCHFVFLSIHLFVILFFMF